VLRLRLMKDCDSGELNSLRDLKSVKYPAGAGQKTEIRFPDDAG
jgi:hypothetical protein